MNQNKLFQQTRLHLALWYALVSGRNIKSFRSDNIIKEHYNIREWGIVGKIIAIWVSINQQTK